MKRRKTRNPVAKHAPRLNKAQVHTDQKRATKRGYIKHKTRIETRGDSKAA